MHQSKQLVKINWFSLRTGLSAEEAKRWLVQANWKLEVAIRNYRFS